MISRGLKMACTIYNSIYNKMSLTQLTFILIFTKYLYHWLCLKFECSKYKSNKMIFFRFACSLKSHLISSTSIHPPTHNTQRTYKLCNDRPQHFCCLYPFLSLIFLAFCIPIKNSVKFNLYFF